MLLIDKRREQTREFGELKSGEAFYYPLEYWYGMKLDSKSISGDNAVDIKTGELASLNNTDEVVPVNAQIVIS